MNIKPYEKEIVYTIVSQMKQYRKYMSSVQCHSYIFKFDNGNWLMYDDGDITEVGGITDNIYAQDSNIHKI